MKFRTVHDFGDKPSLLLLLVPNLLSSVYYVVTCTSVMSWGKYSEKILADPYNVVNYEKLVLAAELAGDSDLIAKSYRLLLSRFPLLTNYWIRYLQWQGKNNINANLKSQYEELLAGDLKYSCALWIAYLKYRMEFITNDDLVDLIQLFEKARHLIGLDYWRSEEFYLLYLQTIWTYKPKNYLLLYYTLVRIILEVPMHNFKVFHQIWLQFLSSLKFNQLKYLKVLNDNKLGKHNSAASQSPLKDEQVKLAKLKWKKTLTDLYITTQYKSYELFKWEKQLAHNSDSNIPIWQNYLQFVIAHYPQRYTEMLFERAVIEHSKLPQLWSMYASYLLNQQKPLEARQVLYRAIKHLTQPESTVARLMDMELYARNYLRARDLLIGYMETTSTSGYSIILFEKLIMVELILHPNDGDYIVELFVNFIDSISGACESSSDKAESIGYILYKLSLVQSIDNKRKQEVIDKFKTNSLFSDIALSNVNRQLEKGVQKSNKVTDFNELIDNYL